MFSPELMFAIGVALTAGLVRGFSGFGAGMIMAPCFSVAFGPLIAIPLIQVMDSIVQIQVVPPLINRIKWKQLFPMIIAAILFMPIGVYLLIYVEQDTMRVSISLLVLVCVAIMISGWRYLGTPSMASIVFTGGLSGLLSGAASMGGPPVVFFNLVKEGAADDARSNIIGFFAVTSIVALIVFWLNDVLSRAVFYYAILLTPVYSIGIYLGGRLFFRASEKIFRRIAFSIIGVSGLIGVLG